MNVWGSLQMRRKEEVCTDPLRRCYDGVWFSSEFVWTEWEEWEALRDDAQERLKVWRDMNVDAVRCRGEGARREYRARLIWSRMEDAVGWIAGPHRVTWSASLHVWLYAGQAYEHHDLAKAAAEKDANRD